MLLIAAGWKVQQMMVTYLALWLKTNWFCSVGLTSKNSSISSVLPCTGIGSPVLSKWSIPCHNMFRNENKYAITLVLFIFVPNCVLAVAASLYICSYQKNIHVSEATMQLKYEYRSIHSPIHLPVVIHVSPYPNGSTYIISNNHFWFSFYSVLYHTNLCL